MTELAHDPLRSDSPLNGNTNISRVCHSKFDMELLTGCRDDSKQVLSQENDDFPIFFQGDGSSKVQPGSKTSRTIRQNSTVSVTSSLGSRSAKSSSLLAKTPSPLDDPNFAPPPPRPIETNHTISQFMAKHEPEKKLPFYEKIKHSGTCLSRLSLMSLMIRRWKPTFWIAYGDSSLLFFRSQKHFDDWLTNKYLSKKERTALVKLHVNFVTDFETDNVQGYQVSRIKSKWYKHGGVMHNFKLDRWYYDGGPTIAGAFASSTPDGIDDLHTIMMEMAKRSPKNKRFMAVIEELAGYGLDETDAEGMSLRSTPMYTTMFADDEYYTPRQAEAYLRMKSAESC